MFYPEPQHLDAKRMVADGSLVESYVDEGAQKDTEIDSRVVQNAIK